MINESTQAAEFLKLFNQLEHLLDRMNQSTQHLGFRRLVEELSRSNQLINTFKVDLVEFLELRNAIVHKSTGEAIAEPNPEAVSKLEQMVEILTNPPKATEIAAQPVYTCTTQSKVIDLIKEMNKNFYTSIPIYHADRFVGVFSENSIRKWLASLSETTQLNLGSVVLSELQDFYDQDDNKFSAYTFMASNTDVFTIRKAFIAFTQEKKRLGSVFLTEHGNRSEKITGIITPWDLHKIAHWQLSGVTQNSD